LQPLPHINPNIYSDLTQQITMSELTETINSSPLHKATGPSEISNEMLQHLSVIGKQILLNIFNACLSIEKTPNSWGHANLWAISKKQHYNNDLTYTRPITLIEHTRKIFTKIITQRLNKVLTQHPILNPNNNVALPFTSTLQPIQTISYIIEHANITKN